MTKTCVACGETKELEFFAIANGVIRGVCKACVAKRRREAYRRNPEKQRASSREYREKNKDKVATAKKKWQQTDKSRGYQKQYHQKSENKERYRKLQWQRKYGIEPERADNILQLQENKCAICGEELTKPFIDHCHKTQKVRGALCLKCNTGIGMFKDDPELLRSAIQYLEKNGDFEVENRRILPSGKVV